MLTSAARAELRQRMGRPQRHRLLHGYPMQPLMTESAGDPIESFDLDDSRPLLIGVLPHSLCNPRIRGCGFCTFPHERYQRDRVVRISRTVAHEIRQVPRRAPSITRRKVAGAYFGGGTANLTPPDEFDALCSALAETFDLSTAEVTLEGVARYFLLHDGALMASLRERLGARHLRISMGVQSFDPAQLERMGRQAFGTADDVAEVAHRAHDAGMTASADLLINLPGQSCQQVLADVETAVRIGLDQVCIYHLVLYAGLGTEWSQDAALLDTLPRREDALDTWRSARDALLEAGFVQTTLTNFERAAVARSPERFDYERCSFHPDVYDAVGFGPGAISTFVGASMSRAVKTVNIDGAEAYASDVERHGHAVGRVFDYHSADLRLLFITRSLPLIAVSLPTYRSVFGSRLVDDFGDVVDALCKEKLVVVRSDELRLTEEGMFYADSIAGLFASGRVARLRRGSAALGDDATGMPMG